MTDDDRKVMCEMIERTVKETVNGKIASLDEKMQNHIDKVEPYLEALTGAKLLGGLLKWVGGLALAGVAIKAVLTGNSPTHF